MATIRWQPAPDPLVQAREKKKQELGVACNQAILGKFEAQVDGVSYYFSNDSEAQSNFKDAKLSWVDGDLMPNDIITWTAYDINDNVVRLDLNKAKFDIVYRAHAQLARDNVSKLRDTLEPQVDAATAPEDVNNIVW
jgi:YHS domain-containing protein